MPENKTTIVKIQRGRYTPFFQVARAHLSAASAMLVVNRALAIEYITSAIVELQQLKAMLQGKAV